MTKVFCKKVGLDKVRLCVHHKIILSNLEKKRKDLFENFILQKVLPQSRIELATK